MYVSMCVCAAQSATVMEYIDRICAEGKTSPNEYLVYDTKPTVDESLDLELWEMWSPTS